MNPWDLFTWITSAGLLISVVAIFVFFLGDARQILGRSKSED